ncbi:MAG: hypothetical protein OXN89_08155, partial [Bryobacterales bacterium]|nr:hypothetical protein [Bryobacterales bacterium]
MQFPEGPEVVHLTKRSFRSAHLLRLENFRPLPADRAAVLRLPAVAILACQACDRRAEKMATDMYNP